MDFAAPAPTAGARKSENVLKLSTAQPVIVERAARMISGSVIARLDSGACLAASVRGVPKNVFMIRRNM